MGLDNAERQARWRAKRSAEIERLRKVAAEQSEQLAEARREIEIVALERENATLKKALAHEREQHAEAKTRAAKAASAFEEKVKAQAMIDGLVQRVRWYEDESRRKGTMTFATASLIAKALHPDSTSSPETVRKRSRRFPHGRPTGTRYAAKPANGRSILHEQPVEPLGLGAAVVSRGRPARCRWRSKRLRSFSPNSSADWHSSANRTKRRRLGPRDFRRPRCSGCGTSDGFM